MRIRLALLALAALLVRMRHGHLAASARSASWCATRARTYSAHRLLPAIPRDSAPRLARAPGDRGVRRGLRPLARRPHRGDGAREPPRLRRRLPPLCDPGGRVRLSSPLNPTPGFACQAGLPGRPGDRPPDASEPLDGASSASCSLSRHSSSPRPSGGGSDARLSGPELERRLRRRRRVRGVVRRSRSGGVAAAAAVLAWFAILALGPSPRPARPRPPSRSATRRRQAAISSSSPVAIRLGPEAAPSRTPTCRSTPCESSSRTTSSVPA